MKIKLTNEQKIILKTYEDEILRLTESKLGLEYAGTIWRLNKNTKHKEPCLRDKSIILSFENKINELNESNLGNEYFLIQHAIKELSVEAAKPKTKEKKRTSKVVRPKEVINARGYKGDK